MNDITTKLRRGFGGLVPPICDEAANEISRLKVELEVSKLHCATLSERYNELERQLAEARASAEAWQENCRLTEDELERERNKHADIIGKLAERDADFINWLRELEK